MLRLIQKDLKAHGVLHLPLGAAVPFWLDEQGQHVTSLSYGNSRKRPIYHIMDALSRLPRSYLVVMAYRNSPHGSDGTIRHVRDELAYARNRNLSIVVGQEFSDVQPAKITFHGQGRDRFRGELAQLNDAFGASPGFGGFSVNDVEAYLQSS